MATNIIREAASATAKLSLHEALIQEVSCFIMLIMALLVPTGFVNSTATFSLIPAGNKQREQVLSVTTHSNYRRMQKKQRTINKTRLEH